nr:family 78 glycoside hydrolase catalytic domain [Agromyces seonyuensis]
MTHVAWEGAVLGSRDRVEWAVRVWDEHDVPGEPASSWFEVGLLDASDWSSGWITGDYRPRKHERRPVDHFRRTFAVDGDVVRARLYATARGVFDAQLNGHRVGDIELAPGSTDYRRRIQYHAFDVADLLGSENTLELRLADGWFRGSLGAYGQTNVFGRRSSVLAQLEMTYADGRRETIGTDDSFAWSCDGPIRFADLQDGEIVDARMTPTYGGRAARAAAPDVVPTASDNVVPRTHEEFSPTLLTTPSGARVLDFGQNLAGFVGFTVTARAGQRIRLRMGEILDEEGEFTQANFQLRKPVREFGRVSELLLMTQQEQRIRGELQPTPKQEVEYICADGVNEYRTRFAVFGFRYALVETDLDIDPADFRAIAVYSDLEQTGDFECSHPGVNQLVSNTRWSMKGNFLDVPTDCPTRERLGWTGDMQVFFDTAASFMDVAAFTRKWLRDLRDAQNRKGVAPAVVPYNGVAMMYDATGGSVGWADALVLVPYRFWKRYGDDDLLRECYPMMRAYGEYLIGRTGRKDRKAAAADPLDRFVYEKGMHLGEWLEPEEFRDDVRGKTPRTEEATAYLHATMAHLAEIAAFLGEPADAARYTEYADGAKQAYRRMFVVDGSIDTDRQAKLVRPLALGLLEEDERARVAERLVTAVESRGHRIGTGFLSTPFVLPVLSEAGRADVAYAMLENPRSPSWLAEVEAGATTVWEDWEGEESRNHYSPGAVCQWLFDTVAGIRVAGENRFEIAPVPGGSLTSASATYTSQYGTVRSAWRIYGDGTAFEVDIPSNTTATLRLPDGTEAELGAGRWRYAVPEGEVTPDRR